MLPHNVHAGFSQRPSFVKTKSFTISARLVQFYNQQVRRVSFTCNPSANQHLLPPLSPYLSHHFTASVPCSVQQMTNNFARSVLYFPRLFTLSFRAKAVFCHPTLPTIFHFQSWFSTSQHYTYFNTPFSLQRLQIQFQYTWFSVQSSPSNALHSTSISPTLPNPNFPPPFQSVFLVQSTVFFPANHKQFCGTERVSYYTSDPFLSVTETFNSFAPTTRKTFQTAPSRSFQTTAHHYCTVRGPPTSTTVHMLCLVMCPGFIRVMPMFCSSGNFQQSSPTTMYGVCSIQDYLSLKTTPLSLLLDFVHSPILSASVQLFCQDMCRFFTITVQGLRAAVAVLPEEQCTVREPQSAFHYPISITMHVSFLQFSTLPFRFSGIIYKSPPPHHYAFTLNAKGAFSLAILARISIHLYRVPSNKLRTILSRSTQYCPRPFTLSAPLLFSPSEHSSQFRIYKGGFPPVINAMRPLTADEHFFHSHTSPHPNNHTLSAESALPPANLARISTPLYRVLFKKSQTILPCSLRHWHDFSRTLSATEPPSFKEFFAIFSHKGTQCQHSIMCPQIPPTKALLLIMRVFFRRSTAVLLPPRTQQFAH
ncbi:hypothetical protein T4D_17134 [Trichinella pseudospiralis]|uniref:Uncharacterized protein n=1 Tax=Trichinella pseudospiralis TaxID=6337 RepID=A0A0V1F583_TRIPS|nr:hypothetical protein T4D_17134 [Trichinella pseudospiralis]